MTSLGCWLQGGKDPRNRNYPYRDVPARRSITHAAGAPISDQNGYNACVGYTCLDTINYAKFSRNRRRINHNTRFLPNPTGLTFYSIATRLDAWPGEAYPPDDTGSTVLAGAKALQQFGFIPSYRWAFTFADFLAAVEQQPVMVGTLWTSGMSDPDQTGLIRPTGSLDGGHAYSVRGVSFARELLRIRNHWGSDWGIKGEAFISFADMQWLLSQQGEVLVPGRTP